MSYLSAMVLTKMFGIGYNYCTVGGRAIIFGICASCDSSGAKLFYPLTLTMTCDIHFIFFQIIYNNNTVRFRSGVQCIVCVVLMLSSFLYGTKRLMVTLNMTYIEFFVAIYCQKLGYHLLMPYL